MTTIHWIGLAILIGGALLGFLPKIIAMISQYSAQPSYPRSTREPGDSRPQPTSNDVQRTLTPEEKSAVEAQDAFKKLKDLEAYFSRVGSTDGLQYICKAGECMFKPPVVSKLAEVKAQPTEFGQSPNA